MSVHGLDKVCGVCDRVSGDHTLREWAACLGSVTLDLPYEDVPADSVAARMRDTFGIAPDVVVADHVNVRALVLTGSAGAVGIALPALEHTFQIGKPGQAPADVAKVLFLGSEESVRGYGRLIRDSANGAVNAARRTA